MDFAALMSFRSSDLINEFKEEKKPSKEEAGNSTSGNSRMGLGKMLYKQGSEKIMHTRDGIPYTRLCGTSMLNFS